MPPVLDVWRCALRHAVVGVAVIAVLMSAFAVHLHVCSCDGHEHGVELALGGAMDGTNDVPASPDGGDAEGCDTCHACSIQLVVPDVAVHALATTVSALRWQHRPVAVPDSLSYPPDLPPAQQG